jgi:PAS domain-containing protein
MLPGPTSFHDTVLSGSSVQSNLSIRKFYECMIPAMASPGQESESLNNQFLVDSRPAMIHTARPGGYLDYFNKRWLECLGVIMYDVSQWKCRAFVHREVEGIVANWRARLATGEKFGYKTRVRGADGEYRWKLHCKVLLRDGRGNNFHVKDLVDRFRANDRTHAVTHCDTARALKFDSPWRDR